jgi:hypothetical protein
MLDGHWVDEAGRQGRSTSVEYPPNALSMGHEKVIGGQFDLFNDICAVLRLTYYLIPRQYRSKVLLEIASAITPMRTKRDIAKVLVSHVLGTTLIAFRH